MRLLGKFLSCAALVFAAAPLGAQVLTLEAARERALARQPSVAALELNARAMAEAAPAATLRPIASTRA